ncbi:MFS transporter [Streptomyces sp. NPDC093085]|uniref:MFS transporter n=1 Tax=Streptomyces sp. NPDC093085 TaxID=3155068 RepID=UPI003430160A
MSTEATERRDGGEPRFRDTVRELPARVWIVSFGILVNRCGNFLPVFIVLYLIGRGHSPGTAGLVLGAAGLGNVLGNAIGGSLADRLGRRWTIVLSGTLSAALTATVPALDGLPSIMAVVGLVGTASQLYRPAAAALLMDSVTTNQQRVAAFAVFRFAMNIGAAVGGLAGGRLATHSYTELFLGNALACLLFAVIAVALLRDLPRGARKTTETTETTGTTETTETTGTTGNTETAETGETKEPLESRETEEPADKGSYRKALADRRLRRFLVMTVIAEFVYIQSTVGLPLHVTAVGLTAADFGTLIGLNGVLVLVCELPVAGVVVKRKATHVLAVGNLLTGLGLALTGFATDMLWLGATVVLWTLGEMMYSSVANAYLGGLSPDHMVGRYQGLYGAAFTLGTGVGPLIGGAVYAYHPWALWIVVGAAGLLSAQLCLPPRRALAPPEERPDRLDQEPA